MKAQITLVLLILFAVYLLPALDVPFSKVPVLTDENKLSDYRRIDPEDWIEDELNSTTWLWHDETTLYALMRCDKDENFSFGNFSARDGGNDGDFLRLQLITIPDAYYAYIYIAYPSGSLTDGVRNPNINVDYSWNSSYTYEVEEGEDYWQVLMRIPLDELRFSNKPPYNWKVIVTRHNSKTRHYYSYPAFSTNEGKNYFRLAADITLHHKLKRSLNVKLKPYFVKSYDLISKTDSFDPDNLGMDISFNPSARIKSKISLNPDFSDVPMDSPSNYYNSRYPVYFSEQRYFFTEDIDAFGVDSDVFYSRNIMQPQFAMKLTGNAKGVYYGFLGARDKKISSNGYVTNQDDYYQLIAIRPETERLRFNNALVSRMNTGYYHHLFSTGLSYEYVKDAFVKAYYMGTLRDNEAEEVDKQQGNMIGLALSYEPKEWDLSVWFSSIDDKFTADSGYFRENNYRKVGYNLYYERENRETFLKSWTTGFWGDIMEYDPDTDPHVEYGLGHNLSFSFLPRASVWYNINTQKERDQIGKDHYYSYFTLGFSKSWERFSFWTSSNTGKSIVYRLNDTRFYNATSVYANLQASKSTIMSLNVSNYYYDYDKISYVETADGPQEVRMDNVYQIINGSMSYNAGAQIGLKMGLGITTYETSSYYANLSYYCNLAYEFKRDSFVYLGYKTEQLQTEKSSLNDPMGQFAKSSASAYLKVALSM